MLIKKYIYTGIAFYVANINLNCISKLIEGCEGKKSTFKTQLYFLFFTKVSICPCFGYNQREVFWFLTNSLKAGHKYVKGKLK